MDLLGSVIRRWPFLGLGSCKFAISRRAFNNEPKYCPQNESMAKYSYSVNPLLTGANSMIKTVCR